MALQYRPVKPVPIVLDDKEYFVRFTFAALQKIKELTGKDLLNGENISPDQFPALIVAGLVGPADGLSVERVAETLDFRNIEYYSQQLNEALNLQVSADTGVKGKNGKAPGRRPK